MMSIDWAEFLAANRHLLLQRTAEHVRLMSFSVLAACVVGLPAGIVAARVRWLATPLITLANLVQTIPSIALLGFLLPVFGIGPFTAAVALFLYALLPIVRNTITGLAGVDPAVVDAARGMGMTGRQLLWRVQLPLARPVIFAGIRTAAVINVGVTTLSALIGAGGLGTFIFRGLATNNMAIILLGALPAAALALAVDGFLGLGERMLGGRRGSPRLLLATGLLLAAAAWGWFAWGAAHESGQLRFGFTSEFMERPDGYAAWRAKYALPTLEARELDPGLLYSALQAGKVDVACGFSTDGRIAAYGLRALDDDLGFFPDYEAAWMVRHQILARHPELRPLLEKLRGAVDATRMRNLNLRVDRDQLTPAQAAAEFLAGWAPSVGIAWNERHAESKAASASPGDVVVGTKNFTEQYVLGQIVRQLIDGATDLQADLKPGLGGTAICFEALARGGIDLYPEYSGTVLSSVLKLPAAKIAEVAQTPDRAEGYLRHELEVRYGLEWVAPLGFSNTYALLVQADDLRFAHLRSISDLKSFLRK